MKFKDHSTVPTSTQIKPSNVTDTAKLLPKLTLGFFSRPRLTALIWIALTVFGVVSYTTLLRREGFPSVSIPIVIVNGTYGANNPAEVDSKLAAPISEIALKQAGVSAVKTSSGGNFFSATVTFDEKINASDAKNKLEKAVKADKRIPLGAQLTYGAPYFGVTGGDVAKVDATISVFSPDSDLTTLQLTEQTQEIITYLQKHKPVTVESFSIADPFQNVTNPVTGQAASVQKSFDRYGERSEGTNSFHRSVIINVAAVKDADVIKLDDQLRNLLKDLDSQPQSNGLKTAISASYAPSIRENISELQQVLLEGLLAVLIIGSIVIAIRASLITVISMVTVIAITIGLVYAIGYSLNVITLFALILGLSLIVDDTIIMVEAIDSARRRTTDRRQAIAEATGKISRAMIAATLTAALSFSPLIFVGGVLGGFIRAIPVTIISALLISLLTALIFIPFFARYLLLGKKQMGKSAHTERAASIEHRIASAIVRPMLWARHHRPREFGVGLTAVIIGLLFIGAGVFMFLKVDFNIFPPSKDSNQVAVNLTFDPGLSVDKASQVAAAADKITGKILGSNMREASYYGTANERTATLSVELIPYGQREATAAQLVDKLKTGFNGFENATVTPYQIDVGPPASDFVINIKANNRPGAKALAKDMASYLSGLALTRTSGEKAKITKASVANNVIYQRDDNVPVLAVSATFKDSDTTTLVGLGQRAIKDKYNDTALAGYGLNSSDISFDLGQESENQDSFKSLLYAFPLVLLAIYILLCIQFRSLLQPLLIFMALPFSILGIASGLYYTNNAFSFFSMLGFFALIGLSIKNTILLTDYANQARRAGMGAVDAVAAALGERFRPLVATSLTAVVSLIPLAVTSPFWQALAVTLIFGLLSSTFLVITVFPYFYLGAEYIRLSISRRGFLTWLGLNILVVAGLWFLVSPTIAVGGFGVLNVLYIAWNTYRTVRGNLRSA